AASRPGKTALEKRYWFLKGSNAKPVATFSSMYRALRNSGEPKWKAIGTALLSAVLFGRKTQKGMTQEQKKAAGIGRLGFGKVYLPNLIQAQGMANTRIYAAIGNSKGLTPGDMDMDEFELTFRTYAPGRDYLTAYDFARMHEGDRLRDKREG